VVAPGAVWRGPDDELLVHDAEGVLLHVTA